MRSKSLLLCCTACCFVVAGCFNPYKSSYMSSIEKWPSGETSRLEPRTSKVKLLSSDDMIIDVQSMMENGYLLLGRAQFHSTIVDEDSAIRQADGIGASVVLISKAQIGTVTQSMPVSQWIPAREVTYVERIHSTPLMEYEHTVTRTVQGEFRTTYVPQTVDYYEFAATFWAKSKKPVLGVIVRSVDGSTKDLLQSNKGVAVEAVIQGSPAFDANILRNDIITRLNDHDIGGTDDFFNYVVGHEGQIINVTFIRGGSTKTLTLQLNKE